MRFAISILALTCALGAGQAGARENRVLKCKPSVARAAPAYPGPALVANIPRSMTPISLNAVQMTDRKLRRVMLVEGLFAMRTPANTLEVTARFVNCTKNDMVIQARSSFMDKNQIPTEPMSVWRNVVIPAYGTGVYQERSIGAEAVEAYLVELRSGE